MCMTQKTIHLFRTICATLLHTICVAQFGLHLLRCTIRVTPFQTILHHLRCTICVITSALHHLHYAICITPFALHHLCCTTCVAPIVLHHFALLLWCQSMKRTHVLVLSSKLHLLQVVLTIVLILTITQNVVGRLWLCEWFVEQCEWTIFKVT